MAIQFLCSACGQPIEVDDDMANLTVTCPYCRKVVLTPAQSNLSARPDLPASAPIPGAVAGATPQLLPAALTPPPRRSVLGWIALGCSAVSILCIVYAALVGYSLVRDIAPQDMQKAETQKIVQERLQSRRDVQIAGLLGPCILPIAGLACAVIALVIGARPRWPAITAICLLGAMVLLSCAGVMMQGMMNRPPGS
jgi:DNA-directed RNA polymerase subunit RPC12/RpoP